MDKLKVVRLTGIEPVRPYGHKILSLGRLPIPPQSLARYADTLSSKAKTPLPNWQQGFLALGA